MTPPAPLAPRLAEVEAALKPIADGRCDLSTIRRTVRGILSTIPALRAAVAKLDDAERASADYKRLVVAERDAAVQLVAVLERDRDDMRAILTDWRNIDGAMLAALKRVAEQRADAAGRERETLEAGLANAIAERDAAVQREAALQWALDRHGRHRDGCEPMEPSYHCACGLDAALAPEDRRAGG